MNEPVYPVLYQGIHYGTVYLAKKFPGVFVPLAYYDKSAIVENITVEFLRGTVLFAARHTRTL